MTVHYSSTSISTDFPSDPGDLLNFTRLTTYLSPVLRIVRHFMILTLSISHSQPADGLFLNFREALAEPRCLYISARRLASFQPAKRRVCTLRVPIIFRCIAQRA